MKQNDKKSPFAGLPLDLTHDIIGESAQIANDIYGVYSEIRENRDKLRGQLNEQGIIKSASSESDGEILTSCGVDGFFSMDRFLTSGLSSCAGFAVEGLIPPSGKKHWDNALYKTLFLSENGDSRTADILKSVMMEMELELAAQAPHDFVFLNGSFVSILKCIMESLRSALEMKESKTAKEFIGRIKASIISFQTIFKSSGPNKTWVGIPCGVPQKELTVKMQWPGHYDDMILLTILLSPGEYTAPVNIVQTELSRVKGLPIKDEKFAAIRDNLVTAMGGLKVVYFRPFEWTPVLRLEIAQSDIEDIGRFTQLLDVIKYQSGTAGIHVPYPIYRAGSMAKNMEQALPALRSAVMSHLTNQHSGDIVELFSLF